MTTFITSPAPALKNKRTTRAIMFELFGAISLLWIASIIFNFVAFKTYKEGMMAILVVFCSIVFCILSEAVYMLPKTIKDFKKDKTSKNLTIKDFFKSFGLKVLDSYGYVTGLILGLMLPVGTPIYVVFVSSFFSSFIVKMLFGGFGSNVFNPAVAGRIFAQLSFSGSLKNYVVEPLTHSAIGSVVDASTGASITNSLGGFGWFVPVEKTGYTFLDLLFGNYSGALGETFALLIIIIGVYLMVRRIIDYRVTLSFVGTYFLCMLVLALSLGNGARSFEVAFEQLMAGSVLFGGVICLTDPVTGPTGGFQKLFYGIFAAFVAMVIRYFCASPEGIAYSILIANMIAPVLDKYSTSRTNKKLGIKSAIIGGLLATTILTVVLGGFYKYKDVTPSSHIDEPNITLVERGNYEEIK